MSNNHIENEHTYITLESVLSKVMGVKKHLMSSMSTTASSFLVRGGEFN